MCIFERFTLLSKNNKKVIQEKLCQQVCCIKRRSQLFSKRYKFNYLVYYDLQQIMIARLFGPEVHNLRHSGSSMLTNVQFCSTRSLKVISSLASNVKIRRIQFSENKMLTRNTCYSHTNFREFFDATKQKIMHRYSDKGDSTRNIEASKQMQAFVKQKQAFDAKEFSSTQNFYQFLKNSELPQTSSLWHFLNLMKKSNTQINQKVINLYVLSTSQGLSLNHDILCLYKHQQKVGREFTLKNLEFYRQIRDQGIRVDQSVLILYELLATQKRQATKIILQVFKLLRKSKLTFFKQSLQFADFLEKNRLLPKQVTIDFYKSVQFNPKRFTVKNYSVYQSKMAIIRSEAKQNYKSVLLYLLSGISAVFLAYLNAQYNSLQRWNAQIQKTT